MKSYEWMTKILSVEKKRRNTTVMFFQDINIKFSNPSFRVKAKAEDHRWEGKSDGCGMAPTSATLENPAIYF